MKAVLVGDMPEKCWDCSFLCHGVTATYNCDISCGKHIENTDVRPDWCPIRPLPDKATPENSDMGLSWNLGWNACLDAIMDKKKE